MSVLTRKSIFLSLVAGSLMSAAVHAEVNPAMQDSGAQYADDGMFEMAPPPPGPYQIDMMPAPEVEVTQAPQYQQPQAFQQRPPQAYVPAQPPPRYNNRQGYQQGYGYMPHPQQAYPNYGPGPGYGAGPGPGYPQPGYRY